MFSFNLSIVGATIWSIYALCSTHQLSSMTGFHPGGAGIRQGCPIAKSGLQKPRLHQTGHEVVPVPWPITDWDVQAGQQLAEVDQLTMPSSKQGLAWAGHVASRSPKPDIAGYQAAPCTVVRIGAENWGLRWASWQMGYSCSMLWRSPSQHHRLWSGATCNCLLYKALLSLSQGSQEL